MIGDRAALLITHDPILIAAADEVVELRRLAMNIPGYRVIEHLSRTRRFDTYEVWSEDRACSCVAKVVREDRRGDQRVREALIAEGDTADRPRAPAHRARLRADRAARDGADHGDARRRDARPPDRPHARRTAGRGRRVARPPPRVRAALPAPPRPPAPRRQARQRGRRGRPRQAARPLVARPPGRDERGVGTWCYLAPEQENGDELGPPADVWGLGITLYEAATGDAVEGRPPSARGRTADVLARRSTPACSPRPPTARGSTN